ncbi:hypothetical protein C5C27_09760 [Rathayibacter sp. AY2B7]|nr:hypothetical protein C5C27_09760 [Rathayibacter sp. AY2B7]
MNSVSPARHWARPMARWTPSMPRTERSSIPLSVIAPAAFFAVRRASSSRMSEERSVVLPEMNGGSPPGCVVESSMRVRGESTKWSRGDGPPTLASSSRHDCHTGSATLPPW